MWFFELREVWSLKYYLRFYWLTGTSCSIQYIIPYIAWFCRHSLPIVQDMT